MKKLLNELKPLFRGDILTEGHLLHRYCHDASIFEMVPEAVLHPRHVEDLKTLVSFVSAHKAAYPTLSITPRSAGTDMSGGAIGNSIVVDMVEHFGHIEHIKNNEIRALPGTFMREITPLLDEQNLMLGCLPASRDWCTIGGIAANNSGGEQSLRFGNAEESVKELRVVLADGNEYIVKPLRGRALKQKLAQNDFEGECYRKVYNLIEENYDVIKNARPRVNKNSMGYNLWSVWDRHTGVFDMTRLFVGSQGTLGIISDVTFQLQPKKPHSGLLVMYLPDQKKLGEIIQTVMEQHPATFEGFDDVTFELGIKHYDTFKKQLGKKEWAKQQASLLGSVAKLKGHMPNLVLMAEFEGESQGEVLAKIDTLVCKLAPYKLRTQIAGDEESSSSFWQIRRASLALLKNRVHNKYASPFIDDLAVEPKYLPEFLPKLRKIIRKYKLPATIAGHFGDGNFHIIPLMNIEGTAEQDKLEPVMREVIPLVLEYNGTLAGEHNDGMIRGPWLPAVFGHEIHQLFRQTKEIFDPLYIFNPHKKTDANWDFSMKHIRTNNQRDLIKESA